MKADEKDIQAERERGHRDGRCYHSYNPIKTGSAEVVSAYREAFIAGRSERNGFEDGRRDNDFDPESAKDKVAYRIGYKRGEKERTFA